MDKKKSKKGLVVLLLILAILIAVVPFLMLKDAEFGGSDDAAGGAIEEIQGGEYEPWFTPILESYLNFLRTDRYRSRHSRLLYGSVLRKKKMDEG